MALTVVLADEAATERLAGTLAAGLTGWSAPVQAQKSGASDADSAKEVTDVAERLKHVAACRITIW